MNLISSNYTKLNFAFSRPLIKKERNLLNYILCDDKDFDDTTGLSKIKKDHLSKIIKIKDDTKVISFLDKFLIKKLIINDHNKQLACFDIITGYYLHNDYYYIKITNNLSGKLIDKNIATSIKSILSFKEKYSYKLFNLLINNPDTFKLPLNDLKILLMNKSYDRFYDFNKHVLSPIVADINIYSELELEYGKIKTGNNRSNKIISLEFFVNNKKTIQIENITNHLIADSKGAIKNFKQIYDLLVDALTKYEHNQVKEIFHYGLKKHKSNFDTFLIKNLNDVNNFKGNRYKLVFEIDKDIDQIFKLVTKFVNLCAKMSLKSNVTTNEPHILTYLLRNEKKLTASSEVFKLVAYYNSTGENLIQLFVSSDI